jgi:hypothetical protein
VGSVVLKKTKQSTTCSILLTHIMESVESMPFRISFPLFESYVGILLFSKKKKKRSFRWSSFGDPKRQWSIQLPQWPTTCFGISTKEAGLSGPERLENLPLHPKEFPFGLEYYQLCWIFCIRIFYNSIYHLLFY